MDFTVEQGDKFGLAKGLLNAQIGVLTSLANQAVDPERKASLLAFRERILIEREDLRPTDESSVDAVIDGARSRRAELDQLAI